MAPKVASPAGVASSLLQVLPKCVEFADIENDNELSAVVTVKVSLHTLHDQTPISQGAYCVHQASEQLISSHV